MSRTRWTAGPWRYCTGSNDRGCKCGMIWSTVADHPVAVGLTHKHESYTLGDGPTEEMRRANAHLIAAAPDLYEALERLATTVDPDNSGMVEDYFVEPMNKARIALARARGDEGDTR